MPLLKRDLSKAIANRLARSALGTDRAHVSKRPGAEGACLWLRNDDRALDPSHAGPLLAAKGQDYRDLVRQAQAGALFESAEAALKALPRDPVPPTARPEGDTTMPRPRPTTVDKMTEEEVRSLLKKLIQGVRSAMSQGSSGDIADYVTSVLTEAGIRLPRRTA